MYRVPARRSIAGVGFWFPHRAFALPKCPASCRQLVRGRSASPRASRVAFENQKDGSWTHPFDFVPTGAGRPSSFATSAATAPRTPRSTRASRPSHSRLCLGALRNRVAPRSHASARTRPGSRRGALRHCAAGRVAPRTLVSASAESARAEEREDARLAGWDGSAPHSASHRGAKAMIAIPVSDTAAPTRSHRSGRWRSTSHSQNIAVET